MRLDYLRRGHRLGRTRERARNIQNWQLALQQLSGDSRAWGLRDDQIVTPCQQIFQVFVQKFADVGNAYEQEIAIAAVDFVESDMRIEDTQLPSLAEQMLQKKHHRALPQIVRVFLESEAENANPFRGRIQNHLNRPLKVLPIAWQHGFEQRQFEVQPGCPKSQRPQIFWKTGAAEGETWIQIRSRDVQLRVLTQRIHHFTARYIHAGTEGADFVGETDVDGMEGITSVLDHFGGAQGHAADGYSKGRVKGGDAFDSVGVGAPDHHERRFHEIADGAALP